SARNWPANPSSLHADGKAARRALEEARARLAAVLDCRPARLTLTSGGTESDSIVLLSLLRRREPGVLIITSIEHPAVYDQAAVLERMGWRVRRVDPRPDGIVDPGAVADACDGVAVMAAVMAVNNETGAIQPLVQIREALDAAAGTGRRIHLHADAAQAFGKIMFPPEAQGVDSAALSAHKIRGPRGIGALYLRRPLEPLAVGGGQEGGIRSGTENLPAAMGFALAAEISASRLAKESIQARALTDRLLVHLRDIPDAMPVPACRVPGDPRYSPWILSLSMPGLPGETAVRILSDAGFALSTGSACSGKRGGRRVLSAMGVPEEISLSAIRVSVGPTTSPAEMDSFAEALRTAYLRYRI
ncbi:MAG TPA: cysteine desulfurase family protein, partial [Magnetospirillaceae bacterium]|nr:cysteine desulfurase family protein [Magnetospirillaceae bacterium]